MYAGQVRIFYGETYKHPKVLIFFTTHTGVFYVVLS